MACFQDTFIPEKQATLGHAAIIFVIPAKQSHASSQCDDGTVLERGVRDVTGDMYDEPYFVKQVSGWHCPVCGEVEFAQDDDSALRVNAAIRAAGAKARENRAQALRATRKKLKLSQAEAERLFGGGASAFSEYERGKTQLHESTVLLLRLLDRHPELLGELVAWRVFLT